MNRSSKSLAAAIFLTLIAAAVNAVGSSSETSGGMSSDRELAGQLETSNNVSAPTPTPKPTPKPEPKPVLPPLSELQKAAANSSKSPAAKPADNSAWLHSIEVGRKKMKAQDFAGAVAAYSECLAANPVFGCYYGRATAYMALKKYDLSMADANAGIKVSPEASEMFSLRSLLHRFDGKPLAALEDIEKAIKFDDENPDYYLERADIYCTAKLSNVSFKRLAIDDQKKAKELGGEVINPCR